MIASALLDVGRSFAIEIPEAASEVVLKFAR